MIFQTLDGLNILPHTGHWTGVIGLTFSFLSLILSNKKVLEQVPQESSPAGDPYKYIEQASTYLARNPCKRNLGHDKAQLGIGCPANALGVVISWTPNFE